MELEYPKRIQRDNDERRRKRKDRWDRAGTAGLWAAAAVGVAAIIASSRDSAHQLAVIHAQVDLTRVQVEEMRAQIDEMRAEQRPWIALSNKDSGPVMDSLYIDYVNGELRAGLKIRLENTGKNPATAVIVAAQMTGAIGELIPYGSMHAWQLEVCRTANGPFGLTMFPGSVDVLYDVQANTTMPGLKGSDQNSVPNTLVAPFMAVCIGYTDAVTGIRHYTPLSFQIMPQPCCTASLRSLPLQGDKLALRIWSFDNLPPI